MEIYINGDSDKKIDSVTGTFSDITRNEFFIGEGDASGNKFKGKMFDIFTFSDVLNNSEIKDLMNKGPFSQTYKKYEANLESPKDHLRSKQERPFYEEFGVTNSSLIDSKVKPNINYISTENTINYANSGSTFFRFNKSHDKANIYDVNNRIIGFYNGFEFSKNGLTDANYTSDKAFVRPNLLSSTLNDSTNYIHLIDMGTTNGIFKYKFPEPRKT